MPLSIIILNYKSANLVKYQLKKLTTYNFSFQTEIIVIDNDSCDNIEEVVKEFPSVHFIQAGVNNGCGAGNNFAAKTAKGDYILFLNPDIRIELDTIEKLYYKIDSDENIGIIAPRLENGDGTIQETCFSFPDIYYPLFRRTSFANTKFGQKWLYKFLLKDLDKTKNSKVGWIMGSCFMIKKSVFDKINGYDDNIFLYLEDTDLCRRVWESGKQVYYMGEVSAIHLHQQQSANKNVFISIFTNRLSRIHIRSWLYYMKKYYKKPTPKID